MLTYGAWQRRFGGDPGVLGRPAEMSDAPVTIVGVLPQDFRPAEAFLSGDELPELWIPLQVDDPTYAQRGEGWETHVLGRLSRGTSLEQARAEVGRIATDLAVEFPDDNVRPDGSALGIGVNESPTSP